jgi:hypothetical protein
VKKLSSFLRSIYLLCRFLPNYNLKSEKSSFDYKFYSNRKLNNNFIEEKYNKRNFFADIDIAKFKLSVKYLPISETIFLAKQIVYS